MSGLDRQIRSYHILNCKLIIICRISSSWRDFTVHLILTKSRKRSNKQTKKLAWRVRKGLGEWKIHWEVKRKSKQSFLYVPSIKLILGYEKLVYYRQFGYWMFNKTHNLLTARDQKIFKLTSVSEHLDFLFQSIFYQLNKKQENK